MDAERREEAETQVEHRRFIGKHPFPEFEEEEREQMEDILDYPPKGSPNYKPRADSSDTDRAVDAPAWLYSAILD